MVVCVGFEVSIFFSYGCKHKKVEKEKMEKDEQEMEKKEDLVVDKFVWSFV